MLPPPSTYSRGSIGHHEAQLERPVRKVVLRAMPAGPTLRRLLTSLKSPYQGYEGLGYGNPAVLRERRRCLSRSSAVLGSSWFSNDTVQGHGQPDGNE